jgi:signal transduction histidine kinase
MDKSWGICPKTMDFFCDTTGEVKCTDPNIVGDRTRYIIKDLVADDDLRERPYVKDWPYMRSYLEVPVTSPLGYVIGGLCVIDNRLRHYTDVDVETLTEVGRTIMSHLEHVRVKNHQARSAKLIKGLDRFIQEEVGIQTQRKASTATPQDSAYRSESERRQSKVLYADLEALSLVTEEQTATTAQSQGDSTIVSNGDSIGPTVPAEVRKAFSRSASVIRASLAIDGLVFMDASSISATARMKHQNSWRTSETPSVGVSSTDYCSILASSLAPKTMAVKFLFPQDLLDRLANCFPRGRIFLADQYGVLSGPSTPTSQSSHVNFFDAVKVDDRRADVNELFALLPQATSVIFLPMWHFQKERWYAAGVGWTCDSTYSFDSCDATSLSAFGNAIMIEVLRYESLAVSKAKSDFISSISHEIRSPLHGILATTELLNDSIQASEERSMLAMIQSCGTTLLDTMNHILEFAKINNVSNSKTKKAQDGKVALERADLSLLVEDVTENVSAGYAFETNPHRQGIPAQNLAPTTSSGKNGPALPVLITLDIQPSSSWEMPLDAGAWKRTVMNLVGNALKYTPKGYIYVSLKSENGEIVFSVRDTGIGIGVEYLKYKLFTPFAQENTFSSGTGLGLAIVQQIVRDIGGHLEVQSEVGVGTCVSVRVPFPAATGEITSTSAREEIKRLARKRLCLVKLATFMPHELGQAYVQTLESSITDIATKWFDMEVIHTTNLNDTKADVYILDGSSEVTLDVAIPTALYGKPVIVITGSRARRQALDQGLTFLRTPFGPRQLAGAILCAMENVAQGKKIDDDRITTNARNQLLTVVSNGTLQKATLAQPSPPLTPALVPLQVSVREESAAPTTTGSGHVPKRDYHILVVDDNVINLKIMIRLLDNLGFSYSTAVNGLYAVEAYKVASSPSSFSASSEITKPFNLIFMDVSMPVMNGFDATRNIRLYETENEIVPVKVIALTGLGDEGSEKEAFACGMDEFWTKPVKLGKVKKLLVDVI